MAWSRVGRDRSPAEQREGRSSCESPSDAHQGLWRMPLIDSTQAAIRPGIAGRGAGVRESERSILEIMIHVDRSDRGKCRPRPTDAVGGLRQCDPSMTGIHRARAVHAWIEYTPHEAPARASYEPEAPASAFQRPFTRWRFGLV